MNCIILLRVSIMVILQVDLQVNDELSQEYKFLFKKSNFESATKIHWATMHLIISWHRTTTFFHYRGLQKHRDLPIKSSVQGAIELGLQKLKTLNEPKLITSSR